MTAVWIGVAWIAAAVLTLGLWNLVKQHYTKGPWQ